MKTLNLCLSLAAFVSLTAPGPRAAADVFGSGDNTFEIEFVTIGDPGNPADTAGKPNPAGSVDYVYRIGKYEISRNMIEMANIAGGLDITLLDMTNLGGNGPNQPATGISWFEAATFANWLNSSSGYPVAYKFVEGDFELWQPGDSGYDAANPFRNRLAHFFLPSSHEWYKAAFYDPQAGVYHHFATGSDTPPTPVASGTAAGTTVYHQPGPAESTQAGGLSPYGTMAQGGNLWEWEETELDLTNNGRLSWRGLRSGSWMTDDNHVSASYRIGFPPDTENRFNSFGFRVAGIPGPSRIGDFNGNGLLDAGDIDMLAHGIQAPALDLTGDGVVSQEDRTFWVHNLADTWFGDASLDGEFNSGDLTAVLQGAKYELGVDAGWADGDWSGDGKFNSRDLVSAFIDGGYERGKRTAAAAVPEPSGITLLTMALVTASSLFRRWRSSASRNRI